MMATSPSKVRIEPISPLLDLVWGGLHVCHAAGAEVARDTPTFVLITPKVEWYHRAHAQRLSVAARGGVHGRGSESRGGGAGQPEAQHQGRRQAAFHAGRRAAHRRRRRSRADRPRGRDAGSGSDTTYGGPGEVRAPPVG